LLDWIGPDDWNLTGVESIATDAGDPLNSDHMLYGTGAPIFGTNLTAWDSGGSFQVSVNALGVEETSVQDLISPPAGPAARQWRRGHRRVHAPRSGNA
jgi:hypothetical protein